MKNSRYSLFIDDIRPCPEGFVLARSSDEAISIVSRMGCPTFISFDHDLGGDDTSMRFLNWLTAATLDGKVSVPSGFSFRVHSANPVGAVNLESKMRSFLKFIEWNYENGIPE